MIVNPTMFFRFFQGDWGVDFHTMDLPGLSETVVWTKDVRAV